MRRPPPPPRPAAGVSDPDYDDWLARLMERSDPVMAWLGVVFALLVGFQLAVEVTPPVGRALDIAGWTIWAVFVVDFVGKLLLAPAKGKFLRRHWLPMLGLLLPTLRLFSFLRLIRLGRAFPAARALTTSYRTVGTARVLLRSRLAYLAALSVIALIALAEVAYVVEGGPGGTLPTFVDALLWAASVVIGMHADPTPVSVAGRIVMLFGFAIGLVVIATLAGTLGAFLLEGRQEKELETRGDIPR